MFEVIVVFDRNKIMGCGIWIWFCFLWVILFLVWMILIFNVNGLWFSFLICINILSVWGLCKICLVIWVVSVFKRFRCLVFSLVWIVLVIWLYDRIWFILLLILFVCGVILIIILKWICCRWLCFCWKVLIFILIM